jgi:hypothetical protein
MTTTILHYTKPDYKGVAPESWCCIDCGVNTGPGLLTRALMEFFIETYGSAEVSLTPESEVYTVRDAIWKRAGMEPDGGCLCIGCLEKRLGRRLKPKDFSAESNFNRPGMPGTDRLLSRRQR